MLEEGSDFPAALTALCEIRFPYRDDGIDYEPYSGFLSADETTVWFRAWTGNGTVTGDSFRVFGQDRTGGYAAFWMARDGQPLPEQPIVFLGSEGETGIVSRNLSDFLWLLAGGTGPLEAVGYGEWTGSPEPEVETIAAHYASGHRRTPAEIVATAKDEFPGFEAMIAALCR